LSRPEDGNIVYRAAAELRPGEGSKFQSDTMVIKKGNYISTTVKDYMKDLLQIGKAFNELLLHTDLDPHGFCVEWYVNDKEVICMVRLAK
jgi:hypothetical protein